MNNGICVFNGPNGEYTKACAENFFSRYSNALMIVGVFILIGLAIWLWMVYPIIKRKRDIWADR